MTKGNNHYGAAGGHAIRAEALIAFLDAYAYEGRDPITNRGEKRINNRRITPNHQRAIRRWRNGHVKNVNAAHAAVLLASFAFDLPWFERWCEENHVPPRD